MIIRKTNPKGFTVVEILMVLMIMGMLLASVAVAFHASSINYRQNDEMYRAMTTARTALLRITNDIRTVSKVNLYGTGADEDIDNKKCSMEWWDVNDNIVKDITYHYNTSTAASYNSALEENTLYLIVTVGAKPGTFILCENVSEMTFDRALVPDDPDKIRNVQISMTVIAGSNSQTISTAAVLKKNLQ
jgi:prepilin-type N-terminal cleavage/methylation domain-containing protein